MALDLTPAYDICPQARSGGEATQAMFIMGTNRLSQLSVCLEAAPQFQLTIEQAKAIIAHQAATIKAEWTAVCDEAALSEVDRAVLWGRAFLNAFAFEGLSGDLVSGA
jgi:serine/threonine-protein kinase HipA